VEHPAAEKDLHLDDEVAINRDEVGLAGHAHDPCGELNTLALQPAGDRRPQLGLAAQLALGQDWGVGGRAWGMVGRLVGHGTSSDGA
jgi:hypothetical protein